VDKRHPSPRVLALVRLRHDRPGWPLADLSGGIDLVSRWADAGGRILAIAPWPYLFAVNVPIGVVGSARAASSQAAAVAASRPSSPQFRRDRLMGHF
jgi:hypothetical protein